MASTPQQATADWVAGIANKTTKITNSVNSVTVSPGVAAARQKEVWAQNTQAAKEKWARKVGNVSLQDWQTSMVNIGIPRMASGARDKQDKMLAAMTNLLPYIEAGRSRLPARGTYDQNKQRMLQWVDHMHAYQGAGSR